MNGLPSTTLRSWASVRTITAGRTPPSSAIAFASAFSTAVAESEVRKTRLPLWM